VSESTLRLLVVDDEELARSLLRELLAGIPRVEVVGECANGFEAVRAAAELDPDCVLLDIQMPKLDGFEVVELLGKDRAVIFVTAYDEHALRAFEVHAVDYLLKPVAKPRLEEALLRARAQRANRAPDAPAGAELARAARAPGTYLERVVIQEGPAIHVLPVGAIDFVEAQDDYLAFHAGPAKHRKQQTLAALEAALDPRRFVRVHRSYLLNLERLSRLDLYAKDSRVAILRDGRKLPVSREGYERLRKLL
jgi:two-component system LytT family response regulator